MRAVADSAPPMPTTWNRSAALQALTAACESGKVDRSRVVPALDALALLSGVDGEVRDAVLALGEAMLAGALGERRHTDILESCVRLLAREPERRALPFYRAASALYVETPRGDPACVLRGLALAAMRPLEPQEARFVAARLVSGPRSLSGEPARTALAVLGAAGDDTALWLACRTSLRDEIPLKMAALQEMSAEVPAAAFWEIAAEMVGDRFADAVLGITDLIVEGRRGELLPGFADALGSGVSDPDLMRAVLLSLLGAHLDGVEAVFAAAVERAPLRAMPGVEEALMLARIANRDALLHRLSERTRRGA
ncbi:MAG TPA: hypothetical protein VN193_13410 [Candidatus Angelobacter sp.]|nr:hypothetical protein [Candidatus Angelobacter sp.]